MKLKMMLMAALGIASANGANLLLNAGFESPAIFPTLFTVLGAGSGFLPNWTVTGATCGGNCVVAIDKNYTEFQSIGVVAFLPHSGNQSLDITGSGNTGNGGVAQTVNLNVGAAHMLSFWVGNMDNTASTYTGNSTVSVWINGSLINSFTNGNNTSHATNWQQFALNFTPTVAVNTIEFRNATVGFDNYAGLDDVVLGEVPEPATLGLVGLAMVGAGMLRRRRWGEC